MKAAILKQYNAPLVIEEVTEPSLEAGWVLVRVKACGMCGSDIKIVSGVLPQVHIPFVPGHEVAGEVYNVGAGVTNVHPGDRVVVYNYITCGHCPECLQGLDNLCSNITGIVGFTIDGGFEEILKVPAANLLTIPENISFEEASILSDALATAYHALHKKAQLQAGETVVILGAGGLGLHAIQIALAMRLKVVAVDVDQFHLEIAAKLGADLVVNSTKDNVLAAVRKATGNAGARLVLEMSGNPEAAKNGVSLLIPRGRMVIVGFNPNQPFEVDSRILMRSELEIVGSRASTRQDLADVIELVKAGKIKPIISETVAFSQINEALRKLKNHEVIGRLVLRF